MSVVIIGPEEMKLIEQAIETARANPVPLDTIIALRHEVPDGGVLNLQDRTPQPIKRPKSQNVVLPGGFRIAISFEQHPEGLARHLSVSSPIKGRIPNTPAMNMIAEAFGFKLPPEIMWLEEFEPGHHAVNLVDFVERKLDAKATEHARDTVTDLSRRHR